MTSKEKSQVIDAIGTHLQENFTTADINSFLKKYRLPFESRAVTNNKKLYVTEIISGQPNEVLTKMAIKLKLNAPKESKATAKQLSTLKSKVTRQFLPSSKGGVKKVFISHSSLDKEIVEKLIDLLKAMGISPGNIFCTSFEGYGIKLGKDFLDALKTELSKNVMVLFVLSKNFYDSPMCMCEMGAAWMATKEHIPILIPPFSFKDVKGVFPNTQGLILTDKNKINSLKESMEKFFNLEPMKHSIWEQDRTNILEEIERRLQRRGFYHY